MHSIATNTPCNVAALDERDPNCGGASHRYAIQFGGPKDVLTIQLMHGPRGEPNSIPGIFDDDLLAISEDRLAAFQAGPFACEENAVALDAVRAARGALGLRIARRMSAGVLGANKQHPKD